MIDGISKLLYKADISQYKPGDETHGQLQMFSFQIHYRGIQQLRQQTTLGETTENRYNYNTCIQYAGHFNIYMFVKITLQMVREI
jgi:hypothetical protein